MNGDNGIIGDLNRRAVALASAGAGASEIVAALAAAIDFNGWSVQRERVARLADAAIATTTPREDGTQAEPLETFSIGEALDFRPPEPELLLPGVDVRRRTLIVAPSETGKTWFMLELALKAAAGQPVLGWHALKRPYRVLFIAAEDHRDDMLTRLRCLSAGSGIRPQDVADRLHVAAGEPAWFGNPTSRARLFATVELVAPDLILFDTIGQVADFKDVNKAEEVTRFYREHVEPLRELAGGAGVVFSHHTNKAAYQHVQLADDAGLIHGSDGFRRVVESVLFIRPAPEAKELPEGGSAFVVKRNKQRVGRRRGPAAYLVALYPDQNVVKSGLPDHETPCQLIHLKDLTADEVKAATRRPSKADEVTQFMQDNQHRAFTKYEVAELTKTNVKTVEKVFSGNPAIAHEGKDGKRSLFRLVE